MRPAQIAREIELVGARKAEIEHLASMRPAQIAREILVLESPQ